MLPRALFKSSSENCLNVSSPVGAALGSAVASAVLPFSRPNNSLSCSSSPFSCLPPVTRSNGMPMLLNTLAIKLSCMFWLRRNNSTALLSAIISSGSFTTRLGSTLRHSIPNLSYDILLVAAFAPFLNALPMLLPTAPMPLPMRLSNPGFSAVSSPSASSRYWRIVTCSNILLMPAAVSMTLRPRGLPTLSFRYHERTVASRLTHGFLFSRMPIAPLW